ncbi:hypothetical protein FF1_010651 [Malus domestica]
MDELRAEKQELQPGILIWNWLRLQQMLLLQTTENPDPKVIWTLMPKRFMQRQRDDVSLPDNMPSAVEGENISDSVLASENLKVNDPDVS